MKKRIWLSILLAAILVLCAFALCSCGGTANCEHRYQGTVSQERTCETDEIITYTCALCQHTYSITTPATGHDLVNHSGKTPTCTEVGWDAYVTCSRCDYTTYEELTPHTMENGECIVCHTPESTPGLEYRFNSDSKSYTVKGIGTCTESDIVIGIYNGYSVTSIDDWAFYGCDSLTSVMIGNSVKSIGYDAFYYCKSLTSVYITDIAAWCNISFDNFSANPLNNSDPLGDGRNLYLNGGLVTELVIPDSVTSIGERAFSGCKSLTSVTIGNGVTSIGSAAFYYCKRLTSVTIGNSVTSIGSSAFCDCTNLTSIVIPNSVTSIGSSAFYLCRSLTSITIPDNVTSIGERAFSGCYNLTIYCEATSQPSGWSSDWNSSSRPVVWGYNNITTNSEYDYVLHNGKAHLTKYKGDATEVIIPSSIDGYEVEFFGSIFSVNKSITSVEIPNSVTSIGDHTLYNCTNLASIIVDRNNPNYKSIDGNLYTKDGKTLIQYAIGKKDTEFEVPNGVTSIGDYAFYYCYNLTSIVIPNSVTSIGDYAFESCDSLTSVVIPDSVTSIGDNAFSYCYNLTIYCEATSQPSGWSTEWKDSNRPVVWGYKGG